MAWLGKQKLNQKIYVFNSHLNNALNSDWTVETCSMMPHVLQANNVVKPILQRSKKTISVLDQHCPSIYSRCI